MSCSQTKSPELVASLRHKTHKRVVQALARLCLLRLRHLHLFLCFLCFLVADILMLLFEVKQCHVAR